MDKKLRYDYSSIVVFGNVALIPQKRTLSGFLIDACFCKGCSKLMIDTDVKQKCQFKVQITFEHRLNTRKI